jgi:hypothetical protein
MVRIGSGGCSGFIVRPMVRIGSGGRFGFIVRPMVRIGSGGCLVSSFGSIASLKIICIFAPANSDI